MRCLQSQSVIDNISRQTAIWLYKRTLLEPVPIVGAVTVQSEFLLYYF